MAGRWKWFRRTSNYIDVNVSAVTDQSIDDGLPTPKKPGRRGVGSDLPMTIFVTLRCCAYAIVSATISSPVRAVVSAPKTLCQLQIGDESGACLFRQSSCLRCINTDRNPVCIQRESARRFAARMTFADVGLGPTQTSSRSCVAQTSRVAFPSLEVSTSACTRVAARRSASSRSAFRFSLTEKSSVELWQPVRECRFSLLAAAPAGLPLKYQSTPAHRHWLKYCVRYCLSSRRRR
jgi:hypothetical protein